MAEIPPEVPLLVQVVLDNNARLVEDNQRLRERDLKLSEELFKVRQEIRDAQAQVTQSSVTYNSLTSAMSSLRAEMVEVRTTGELCNAKSEKILSLLRRVRANALASFFLSSALTDEITKVLGDDA